MFPKNSFSVPQTSGFVAFDGGGTLEADARRADAMTPASDRAPRLEPELVSAAAPSPAVHAEWLEGRTWQPTTSILVRHVEGAVVGAICAYFAFGLAGLAGWI